MSTARHSTLHIPAREIPIPSHLSPQAAGQLAQGTLSNPPWPEQDDIDGWRRMIAQMNEAGAAGLGMMAAQIDAAVEEIDANGVRIFVVTPSGLPEGDEAVYMDLHGGALLWGDGDSCRAMGKITASMMRAKVWAVDYRMAPDHPFPSPVDDCVTAYRALLRERAPAQVIVGGASAGGNFAAAAILKARDQGVPLPAACVLMTPEIDLTESGDSFRNCWESTPRSPQA